MEFALVLFEGVQVKLSEFRIKTIVLTAVLLFLFASIDTWAATYYVDFGTGADTNSGTDSGHPWQHCPGDANATNSPAGTILHASDTVIFKGSVQYTGVIALTFSGSSGSSITYDGNSAGTFGTGQAIIDGGGSSNPIISIPNSISYVTITNFEIRNGLNNGIYDRAASNHIIISGCIIHNTGKSPYVYGVANETGTGISLNGGGTNWEIKNCSFYDCYGIGISINPGSNNLIHDNDFHDTVCWGVRICTWGGVTANSDSNQIYNNKFHDIYYYDGLGPHTDFIFIDPENGKDVTNTQIYGNFFYNNYTFTNNGGTAFINFECDGGNITNLYIWNNSFFNPHSYFTISTGSNGGNVNAAYIYENSAWTTAGFFYLWPNGNAVSVTVKNNAITALGSPYGVSSFTGLTIVSDYNCYNPAYSNFVSEGTSWAQWKALGYDASSLTADPKFVNTTIGSENLGLKANSPCLNAGMPLGSPYNTDILGASRLQGSRWDIGAYEYSGIAGLVNAPTGIRIKQ